MVDFNPTRLIITLDVNGLNMTSNGRDDQNGIKKQYLTLCYVQETHFRHKDIDILKIKGNSGVVIFIKIDLKRGILPEIM